MARIGIAIKEEGRFWSVRKKELEKRKDRRGVEKRSFCWKVDRNFRCVEASQQEQE
jgi:hypothetical protein